MPYIGASELTLILPAGVSIGTNTLPINLDEVTTAILEVSAEIDAAAAAGGYGVPIVSPASGGPTAAYAQMAGLAKKGVGAQILRTIFPNISNAPGSRVTLADQYAKAYEDALKLLRQGSLVLIGASADSGGAGRELPRSYYTSNTWATAGVLPTIDLDSRF